MKELSLFSGGGGGVWAGRLLGWRTVGYVEFNKYCQKIIRARIEDGSFDEAPIFGDIRTFISDGYADSYKGLVDIVTGGFPCQPFSLAGKRLGDSDERNMWPATIDVIRRVRPRFAFLENVPNLRVHQYVRRIFGDLAEAGYDCRWQTLSAASVGAPHKRERLWILATDRDRRGCGYEHIVQSKPQQGRGGSTSSIYDGGQRPMANTSGNGRREMPERVPDEVRTGPEAVLSEDRAEAGMADPTDVLGQWNLRSWDGGSGSADCGWWETEPHLDRVVDGLANRCDRIRALGNGQVPLCAAVAFRLLAGSEPEAVGGVNQQS